MAGNNEPTPPEPTVASILGIQGPLRFRTHGATQKAHVVLRQVDISEESEENSDGKPMVYFSLFAQKRIEVKPGKEILLAVATPDGRFIDTPVMFTGEMFRKDSQIPEEPVKKASPKPPTPPSTPISLPPRLRKTWNKANESSPAPSTSQPIRTYDSIGVQCDLTYSSHSVQTSTEPEADRMSCSVQTEVGEKPVSTVDTSLSAPQPMQLDEFSQVENDDRAASSTPGSPMSEPYSPTLSVNLGMNFSGRDRSLSPMELDSPGSSPTLAPTALPTQSEEDRPKSMSLSPPSLSVSTSPTSVPSKLDLNVTPLRLSPDSSEPPGLAIPTYEPSHPATPSSLLTVHEKTISQAQAVDTRSSDYRAFVSQPQSQPDTALYKPRRKPVHNPFVSGGLLTDFVSGSAEKPEDDRDVKEKSDPVINLQRQDAVSPSAKSPLIQVSNAPSPSSSKVKEEQPNAHIQSLVNFVRGLQGVPPTGLDTPSPDTSKLSAPEGSWKPAGSWEPPRPPVSVNTAVTPPFPSAAADSYVPTPVASGPYTSVPTKVMPPPPPPRVNEITKKEDDKPMPILMPPRISHGFFPPGPRQNQNTQPKRSLSPPPVEAKLQPYVPSPTYTNPLGIRPSGDGPFRPPPLRTRQPSESKPIITPQPIDNKKRVVVGNGWPHNRQNEGIVGKTSPNTNFQQRGDRSASWNGGAAWPEPSRSPPPPPPRSGPGIWPEPSGRFDHEEEYDPRNPMHGFNGPPPGGRDGPYPPAFLPPQYGTPTPSRQPSRASSIDTPISAPPSLPNFPPQHPPQHIPQHPPHSSHASHAPPPHVSHPPRPAQHQVHHPPHPPPSQYPPPPFNSSFPSFPPPPQHAKHPQHAQYSQHSQPPPHSQHPSNGQPVTPTHPLPPKPLPFKSPPPDDQRIPWSPKQNLKRMASPEPAAQLEDSDMFRWPILRAAHTSKVKGDEEIAVSSIVFSSDGSLFAITCHDRTVRIWNNRTRMEIARLGHTMPVLAAAWMEHDSGVVTLGDNGIVSNWTRSVQNKWQWAKILDAGGRNATEKPTCFAFGGDRIAIAFPQGGVKVWLFIKGTWLPQRSISQHNVTTIKFVDDGDALMGATAEGVLWHCGVPNGILKVSAFLKSKVLSMDATSRNAIIALADRQSQMLTISSDDHKGSVEHTYAFKEPELLQATYEFGAVLANKNQSIVFGSVKGCVAVWDRSTADVSFGMSHAEDDRVMAVSCFEGTHASNSQIVTGTRSGRLTWFVQPGEVRKRMKVS